MGNGADPWFAGVVIELLQRMVAIISDRPLTDNPARLVFNFGEPIPAMIIGGIDRVALVIARREIGVKPDKAPHIIGMVVGGVAIASGR